MPKARLVLIDTRRFDSGKMKRTRLCKKFTRLNCHHCGKNVCLDHILDPCGKLIHIKVAHDFHFIESGCCTVRVKQDVG